MELLTIFVSFPTIPLTDWRPSGDGLLAHRLITELAARGHSIHVATVRADLRNPLPPQVKVYELDPKGNRHNRAGLTYMVWSRTVLAHVQRTTSVDVVHELNPVFTALSLAFAGSRVPVVLGPHSSRWPRGADSGTRGWHRLTGTVKNILVWLQHRFASAVLLTTPAALNNVSHPEKVVDRLYLLPPGIDDEAFSPAPRGENAQSPSILFLANILERKGILTLLQAFDELAKEHSRVRLVIAGDGKLLPAVRQQVAAAHYAHRVTFTGRVSREQTLELMRQCSIFTAPSHGEPFGITALEAMACGKPLVVTNAGGLGYVVSDEGGRRVPVRDAAALKAALAELLGDALLCRGMGVYNRRQIELHYAWPKIAERLENIYRATITRVPDADRHRVTELDISDYRRRAAAVGMQPIAGK